MRFNLYKVYAIFLFASICHTTNAQNYAALHFKPEVVTLQQQFETWQGSLRKNNLIMARMLYPILDQNNFLTTYDYYNGAVFFEKFNEEKLANDALIKAIKLGYSVWDNLASLQNDSTVLSIMKNKSFLKKAQKARQAYIDHLDIHFYAELYSRLEVDQTIRWKWMSSRDSTVKEMMEETDRKNAKFLFHYMDSAGIPHHSSYEINFKFFALFLHATSEVIDTSVIDSFIIRLETEVNKGNIRPATLALWYDRYREFNMKKPQVYGTFWTRKDDGKLYLEAVEDPGNIDKLRESVGLPHIEKILNENPDRVKPTWYQP